MLQHKVSATNGTKPNFIVGLTRSIINFQGSFSTQSSFVTLLLETRIPRSIIQIGNYERGRKRKISYSNHLSRTFWGLTLLGKLNLKRKHYRVADGKGEKGTRTSPFFTSFPFLMLQLLFSSCIHLLFMREANFFRAFKQIPVSSQLRAGR